MNDTLIQLIFYVATGITAAVMVWQITRLTKAIAAVREEVLNTHRTFNSKTDALLTVTGQAEHAKGVLEGRAQSTTAT